MANHDSSYVPNYETENPFEGKGRASQKNDIFDVGIGFIASFGFFATMFIIAVIVEVATR